MSVENIITSLFASIAKDNIDLANACKGDPFIDEAIKKYEDGPEEMFFSFGHKLDSLVDGVLLLANPEISSKEKFLFAKYDFVDSQLCKLFERVEGSACSADKSRTIIRLLVHHFKSGELIELNYSQEYTYHLPKKILRTHDEILSFFNGIFGLYYGNFEPYLNCLKEISLGAKEK